MGIGRSSMLSFLHGAVGRVGRRLGVLRLARFEAEEELPPRQRQLAAVAVGEATLARLRVVEDRDEEHAADGVAEHDGAEEVAEVAEPGLALEHAGRTPRRRP